MPEQYDNELRFALFRNHSENPKAPNFKGSVQVNGKKYWLSAWKKTAKNGDAYLSGALQLAEEEKPAPKPKAQPKPTNDLDDDVPF